MLMPGGEAARDQRFVPPEIDQPIVCTITDQNIAVDNIAANADVEALPPDESSETPSNELINGADNADVGDLIASSNSF